MRELTKRDTEEDFASPDVNKMSFAATALTCCKALTSRWLLRWTTLLFAFICDALHDKSSEPADRSPHAQSLSSPQPLYTTRTGLDG